MTPVSRHAAMRHALASSRQAKAHGATNAGGDGEVDICIASNRQEISAQGSRGETDLGTSQCLPRPTPAVALNKPPLLVEHFFASWKHKLLPVHLCSLLQS